MELDNGSFDSHLFSFPSCTYSDKRDVLFLLVRRTLSSLADFVAGGLELLQFSGWFSNRDPKRRGSTNHTQRCGLLQEWRAFGGPDCEASGQYCQHGFQPDTV